MRRPERRGGLASLSEEQNRDDDGRSEKEKNQSGTVASHGQIVFLGRRG
jgi:hypothetical protein